MFRKLGTAFFRLYSLTASALWLVPALQQLTQWDTVELGVETLQLKSK